MTVKSSQIITVDFITPLYSDITQAAVNADALPTGVLSIDGTDNGAVVTVTNKSAGVYKASVTLPALTIGQVVSIRITAVISGVTQKLIIWNDTADGEIISDVIWDEVLTGATHNVTNSSGRRLRQITSTIIHDGIAVGAGVNGNQIILDALASATNGAYDPATIAIIDGTGAGQCRNILDYDGGTQTATVDRSWRVNPAADSEFIIYADAGREHVNEGLVRAATANTVQLNTSASVYDDAYNGQIIFIRSGTGDDQARRVLDYDGASKTATVYGDWNVIPDTTSAYVILPTGMLSQEFLHTVWQCNVRTLTTEAITGVVSGSSIIQIIAGDTVSVSITGLGSLANRSKLYFTVKESYADDDDEAIIQIEESGGLLYLNGAAGTALNGSITIDSEADGDITITLAAADSLELLSNTYVYDVQIIRSSGIPVTTLALGKFEVNNHVTKAVS